MVHDVIAVDVLLTKSPKRVAGRRGVATAPRAQVQPEAMSLGVNSLFKNLEKMIFFGFELMHL